MHASKYGTIIQYCVQKKNVPDIFSEALYVLDSKKIIILQNSDTVVTAYYKCKSSSFQSKFEDCTTLKAKTGRETMKSQGG